MHPQLRPFNVQLFLDFCVIFFPEWPLFFFVHDSPSNLAESRYPRGREQSDRESVIHGKIALAHEHNWASITSTSARGAARTSARRLDRPARAGFFFKIFLVRLPLLAAIMSLQQNELAPSWQCSLIFFKEIQHLILFAKWRVDLSGEETERLEERVECADSKSSLYPKSTLRFPDFLASDFANFWMPGCYNNQTWNSLRVSIDHIVQNFSGKM